MANDLELQQAQAPAPLQNRGGAIVPSAQQQEDERYDLTYTGKEVQELLDEVHNKDSGIATQDKAGYMSKDDKKKLDELENAEALSEQDIIDACPLPDEMHD